MKDESQTPITLPEIFKGHEIILARIIHEIQQGLKNRNQIIEDNITPILKDLQKNAGQEIDGGWLYYAIQYALNQKNK